MNSVWRSLLWKEWREHRWKMAALVAIALVAPVLMSLDHHDLIVEAVYMTIWAAVPLGAMFVGMHAAASENSQGTIRFLQALPAPLPKAAAAKLFWAAVTVIAMPAAAVLAATAWNAMFVVHAEGVPWNLRFGAPWGISHGPASPMIMGAAGGLSILLWMAAAGVNRSDEVRAAAVGLLMVLVCWALFGLAVNRGWSYGEVGAGTPAAWSSAAIAAMPGGPAGVSPWLEQVQVDPSVQKWANSYLAPLAAAVTAHGALAAWFIARFGRMLPRRESVLDQTCIAATATAKQLGPPRRSPLAALIWKQTWESAPLAACGAGVILLMTAICAVVLYRNELGNVIDETAHIAISAWMLMGVFVAVVASVGAFMDDLRPGLHTFWRSRPINVNQWFAVKTALTMSLTMAILAIPPMLIAAIFWGSIGGDIKQTWRDMIPLGLMFQAGLFAAAAAVMTLVRQAIYSAILAIALAVAYLLAVVWIFERTVPQWDPNTYPVLTAFLFATPTAGALFAAWLAVRNNWGWKG